MSTATPGTTKIAQNLLLLHQQRATGELVVTHGKQPNLHWKIYFYLGRIVYATGGTHPVRRWYRAFKQNCPECFNASWLIQAQSEAELWEVDLLNQALGQGFISATQYKATVQSVVQEVMFILLGQKFFTTEWHPGQQISQHTAFLSAEQLIQESQHLRDQWRDCGLGFLQELMAHFSPDLAPILRKRLQLESQVSSDAYRSLLKLMRGQHTLWDVAIEMQRPLPLVLRSLLPWIRHGMIELKEVPDLPALCSKPISVSSVESAANKALIACIDTHAATGHLLAQMVQPHYELLNILNPLRGIPTLLERKPSLIFLDPTIVETNGYDFCALLSKTPELRNTPIVILTKQDGMVDRVRARLSGASEFLTKPPEAAKVQQVIQKYLHTTLSSSNLASSSSWVVA